VTRALHVTVCPDRVSVAKSIMVASAPSTAARSRIRSSGAEPVPCVLCDPEGEPEYWASHWRRFTEKP
jgi:hypothetical protein